MWFGSQSHEPLSHLVLYFGQTDPKTDKINTAMIDRP